MDEIHGEAEQDDGIGLVQQRDNDVDVGENGQHAQCDLQCDHADQPLHSVLNIGGIILLFDIVEHHRHEDNSQQSKPGEDEDNNLHGHVNVNP